MKAKRFSTIVKKWAKDCVSGKNIVGREVVLAAQRYLNDLERKDIELRTKEPDLCINIIQTTLVHQQGENIQGEPLLGKPFLLEPWQMFVIYNLLGFYYKGTQERRYKEAFIEIGRKNGKTSLVAALAWAVSIMQRHSGSKTYIVANALKQTLESFHFLTFSLEYQKVAKDFKITDHTHEHSIKYVFRKPDGTPDGSMEIIAMPSNPESQDSFNCNFAIADEVAAYRKPAQYNRFKESQQAYTNRLMIGITTAGDNINSFGYRRQEYGVKVVSGEAEDDSLFVLIARADENEDGEVDYLDPVQHQKANLSYGVTIRPESLIQAAQQARIDPQQRKDFLSRHLNRYTNSMKSWFDIDEFKNSDGQYTWTLEELAKLPIEWYGGADLSRMYDLTAAALIGNYEGVDIIITHAFFPVTQANLKAEEDNIPVYEWLDNGWLTLCNNPTVNASDIVNWFSDMRAMGFKIKQVGHDRKFAGEEYFPLMKQAKFSIIDQPQLYYLKNQGFRHIEKAAKDGKLYYMHSTAYEYCVSNVKGQERVDDAVAYEKIGEHDRIDLFDASVFACIRMLKAAEKRRKAKDWFGD